MEGKTSTSTKIIIGLVVILLIWGFLRNNKENREAKIISAVEDVCKKYSLNIDCLDFGYDVVDKYNDLNTDDPRDYGE